MVDSEPKLDLYAVPSNNWTGVEEKGALIEEGDSFNLNMSRIKEECADYTRDFKTDSKIEKISTLNSFPLMKIEPLEELLDEVAVKEELHLEETIIGMEVPNESIRDVHNDLVTSEETWNILCDNLEKNSCKSLSMDDTSSFCVSLNKDNKKDEIVNQKCGKNLKIPLKVINSIGACKNSDSNLSNTSKPVVVGPFKCDVCSEDLSTMSLLNTHLRDHTCHRSFKCDICGKCFTKSGGLKRHLRIHTGDKPYRCEVCGKCFPYSSSLRSHLRTHSGIKPFKCDDCDKCFAHKVQLNVHLRTHTGKIPFKCDFCGKGFALKSRIINHLRVHTDNKPFKCNDCGKCFRHYSCLYAHVRLHKGDKRFKCDICSKCFMKSPDLKRHLRVHTGDKPFKCDVCDKCFSDPSTKRNHLLTHRVNKPFRCNVCGKSCTHKTQLNVHLRKHIGDQFKI